MGRNIKQNWALGGRPSALTVGVERERRRERERHSNNNNDNSKSMTNYDNNSSTHGCLSGSGC